MRLSIVLAVALLAGGPAFARSAKGEAKKAGFIKEGAPHQAPETIGLLPVTVIWNDALPWTGEKPGKAPEVALIPADLDQDALQKALDEKLLATVKSWGVQARKLPVGITIGTLEGRISSEGPLAISNGRNNVKTSISVVMTVGRCEGASGVTPCLSGTVLQEEFGDASFAFVVGWGSIPAHEGREPKLEDVAAVVRPWRTQRKGKTFTDTPLMPKAGGSFQDQVVDLLDQGLVATKALGKMGGK